MKLFYSKFIPRTRIWLTNCGANAAFNTIKECSKSQKIQANVSAAEGLLFLYFWFLESFVEWLKVYIRHCDRRPKVAAFSKVPLFFLLRCSPALSSLRVA